MVFCLWQLCEFVYWWLVPHPAVFVICLYVCMYVCVYVCMYVCVNFPCIVNFLCILFLVYQRKNFITCNASYTGCPTRYRTRHFFNNFTANEDIATILQHTLQTHSPSFLTQRTYSCSNFVAISSLVLELLNKCRVR